MKRLDYHARLEIGGPIRQREAIGVGDGQRGAHDGELVEDDHLSGSIVAAILVWANKGHPPLLRTNPMLVPDALMGAVRLWASAALMQGQTVAILRADAIDVLHASRGNHHAPTS